MSIFDHLPWNKQETQTLGPRRETALRTPYGAQSMKMPTAKNLRTGSDMVAKAAMAFVHKEPLYNAALQLIADRVSMLPPVMYEWTNEDKESNPNTNLFGRYPQLRSPDIQLRKEGIRTLVSEQKLVELPRHPLLNLLMHPNEDWTGSQFWGLWVKYVIHSGEAVVLKYRNGKPTKGRNVPTSLLMFPPHSCTGFPTKEEPFFKFSGITTDKIGKDGVWLSKRLDPTNPAGRGLGLGKTLKTELMISIESSMAVLAAMENRALPDYHITVGGRPTKVQKEEISNMLKDKFSSVKDRGLNMVTGDNIKVEKISHTMIESGAKELREQSRDFLMSYLGVPRELMGLTQDSNRSTAATAEERMMSGCVMPVCDFLRSQIQHHLVPLYGDNLVVDFRAPSAEDKKHKLNLMKCKPDAFTLNEWRIAAGFDPIEGQDELVGS